MKLIRILTVVVLFIVALASYSNVAAKSTIIIKVGAFHLEYKFEEKSRHQHHYTFKRRDGKKITNFYSHHFLNSSECEALAMIDYAKASGQPIRGQKTRRLRNDIIRLANQKGYFVITDGPDIYIR